MSQEKDFEFFLSDPGYKKNEDGQEDSLKETADADDGSRKSEIPENLNNDEVPATKEELNIKIAAIHEKYKGHEDLKTKEQEEIDFWKKSFREKKASVENNQANTTSLFSVAREMQDKNIDKNKITLEKKKDDGPLKETMARTFLEYFDALSQNPIKGEEDMIQEAMNTVSEEFAADFKNKKEAEREAEELPPRSDPGRSTPPFQGGETEITKKMIPVVIKADTFGSLEAIEKEIEKIKVENAELKIVNSGIGPIGEGDVKSVSGDAIVIGFNVKADRSAGEVAEKRGITITLFDIIYKMSEWLAVEVEKRRPRIETEESAGRAKILKTFSRTKERQIVGGKVVEGKIVLASPVKILRREFEIGRGKIINLEKNKAKVSEVEEGSEFGMLIESKTEIVPGDAIESFSLVQK